MTIVTLRHEEYYQQKIYNGEGRYVKKKAINANGYNRINKWMGVTFLSPDTILGDDGMKLPNPYIERDPQSGEVARVRVRRVGVGRNNVGESQVIDLICVYDVKLYFASDAYNKWKYKKEMGKLLPSKPEKSSGLVVGLPVGQACLDLDMSNEDVHGLLREHIDRQKYAERNAITICQRNILNQFVGTRYADDNGRVPIVHWSRPDLTSDQMESIRNQLNEGKQMINLGGEVIGAKVGYVEVQEDDHEDIDNDE
jgi:hypothetical protein